MRLFLDAHVSGRRIARALRDQDHDVRAADEEHDLDGMDDEELLALATLEERVLITFDAKDFSRIVQRWGSEGRHHAGCAMLVRIDHSEFGMVTRLITHMLANRPDPTDWQDYTCFVSRPT